MSQIKKMTATQFDAYCKWAVTAPKMHSAKVEVFGSDPATKIGPNFAALKEADRNSISTYVYRYGSKKDSDCELLATALIARRNGKKGS
jgi:hypothetical protein